MIAHAAAAHTAAGTGEPTADFDAAVEAMILMAGPGFESGGLSIAHALTRGLSYVPGAASAAHGLQVAYGLIVQLELEGNGFPPELLDLYRAVDLPMSLAALGVTEPREADFEAIAAPSAKARHILNFSRPVSEADLTMAMRLVEERFGRAPRASA
ncbi:iron-containing alcohol dehydrogenase [Ensifer sp. YR511]|uniref:iron-containing alcohol dehydrogenase n=1 Tax=Ensifer sp. YR511 TaxID=1855294 RepID=UPI000A456AE5|nr:iron-containing alcohol dehydrogenase [Ensifer sp. YR511]